MIDVLKRLAELDAKNPNVVKENDQDIKSGLGIKEQGVAESQLGQMGLDAYPDELDRMRATQAKMDSDTEWLLKNKPTNPCEKCGDDTTYRSSFGTTQTLKCARCGKVRLSTDDRKEHRDMAEGLQECGMMGSMSTPHSHTPATINMTADSGAELTGMLKDIMSLAGLRQVTPHDLGHDHEPAVLSAEPNISVTKVDSDPMDMKSLVAKIDSMNDPIDDETVKEWDNDAAEDINGNMDNEAMLNRGMHNQDPAGTPGAAEGRHLKNHPVATPEETYESLMADYRKFIAESDLEILGQGVAEES